jgi:hypothetical protein
MDRVSDDRLRQLQEWIWDKHQHGNGPARRISHDLDLAILELRARREAERRPDPLSQALNEGDGSYRP